MWPAVEYAFLGATLLFLCAAAWTDLRSRTIPNVLPAAVLVVALAACIVLPEMRADLGWRGVSLASMILIGLLAFGGGVLGGGDVKLLIALSPWVTVAGLAELLLFVGAAGGVLAGILILIALAQRRGLAAALRQKIPYGVAILAGVVAIVAI